MKASLFEVKDVCVCYGKVEVINNVSLSVKEGSIVSVIGPNGAGKTTLLAAMMGLLPSTGVASYKGVSLHGKEVETRVAEGIALVPEQRELFSAMTVADNLTLGAFHRYLKRDDSITQSLEDVYQRFPRLLERREQLAGTLSGGERQMLALGRALMSKPTLLMLDEPSLGLAPLIVRDIFKIIADLRDTGVSILLVEQNARAALQLSDYAYVLEMGKVALEGESAHLIEDRRLIETYLGLKSDAAKPQPRVSAM
jgi:branched-chain amino acid transport system ATP-binding protein